jgi:hypothetical protein
MVLRLLNLTVFRSLRVGEWIQRQIVDRLVTARTRGPLTLERYVTFLADRIEFRDAVTSAGAPVEAIEQARALTGIHMGSARYFHSSELETAAPAPAPEFAAALHAATRAERAFTIRIAPHAAARETVRAATPVAVFPPSEVVGS